MSYEIMNPIKIIDTASAVRHPDLVKLVGFAGVVRYCSNNSPNHPAKVPTLAEVKACNEAGLAVGLVFERFATIEEFKEPKSNAARALSVAKSLGLPKGLIFFAADADFSAHDWNTVIQPYFDVVHEELESEGMLVGVYGSWFICKLAKDAGYAHVTWMDQSPGHCGHAAGLKLADIVQGPSATVAGNACDTNEVRAGLPLTSAGLWVPNGKGGWIGPAI